MSEGGPVGDRGGPAQRRRPTGDFPGIPYGQSSPPLGGRTRYINVPASIFGNPP